MTEFLEGPRYAQSVCEGLELEITCRTEILNLNVLDERSGTSLLHEAAR